MLLFYTGQVHYTSKTNFVYLNFLGFVKCFSILAKFQRQISYKNASYIYIYIKTKYVYYQQYLINKIFTILVFLKRKDQLGRPVNQKISQIGQIIMQLMFHMIYYILQIVI